MLARPARQLVLLLADFVCPLPLRSKTFFLKPLLENDQAVMVVAVLQISQLHASASHETSMAETLQAALAAAENEQVARGATGDQSHTGFLIGFIDTVRHPQERLYCNHGVSTPPPSVYRASDGATNRTGRD